MKTNKKGVTLVELLAYITLVGTMIVFLSGTLTFAMKSYDDVNGEGAVYTEANFIMGTLITQANVFNPQYIRDCGENCVELVIETVRKIDSELGLIVDEVLETPKTSQIRFVKKIEDENNNVYDIYIGGMKLNNKNYGVLYDKSLSDRSGSIEYTCYDESGTGGDTCQKFVLSIRLAIVRINDKAEIVSEKPYVFENRFAF